MAKKYVFKQDVETPKAYCVKCRKKRRTVTNGKIVVSDSGRYMYQGPHKVCGTKMSVMISKDSVRAVKSSKSKVAGKTKRKRSRK